MTMKGVYMDVADFAALGGDVLRADQRTARQRSHCDDHVVIARYAHGYVEIPRFGAVTADRHRARAAGPATVGEAGAQR